MARESLKLGTSVSQTSKKNIINIHARDAG